MVDTDATAGPTLKDVFDPGETIVAGFRLAPRDTVTPLEFHLQILRGAQVVRTRTVEVASADFKGAVKVPVPIEGLASGEYTLSILALRGAAEIAGDAKPFRISDLEFAPSP